MKTTVRNSRIELLKVVGMVMIIFSSAIPYGATYKGGYSSFIDLNIPGSSIQQIIYLLFRWFGQVGDILFITSSAWFLCDSNKTKFRKVVELMCDAWFFSLIGLGISLFFLMPSNREIIKSFIPITTKRNWFITCYIMYYLIHPYVNKAITGLEKDKLKRICVLCFLLYSLLASFSANYYYYTDLVAFVMIHIMVYYLKHYCYSFNAQRLKGTLVICFALIIAWVVFINVCGSHISFLQHRGLLFCRYNNPIILCIGFAGILLATKKVWESDVINVLSRFSLIVYLIHGNYFWLTYGKFWLYDYLASAGMPLFLITILMIMLYLIITFSISGVYRTFIRHHVYNLAYPRIAKLLFYFDKLLAPLF